MLPGARISLGRLRDATLVAAVVMLLTVFATAQYDQRNLTADIFGNGYNTDGHLVNGWGLSYQPSGVFWVSDNGTGVSTLYSSLGVTQSLVVTIPTASGAGTGSPTGQVANTSSSFMVHQGSNSGPAQFIFATLDGTISGWSPNVNLNSAIIAVNNSSSGTVYTGLAIALTNSGNFIYAADAANNKVDQYDGSFNHVRSFTDTTVPPGFTPYGIRVINNTLYVTYAKLGNNSGYLDTFDLNGGSFHRLVSAGNLNAPWGIALAPNNFGQFSNDLLVANLGSGWINVYNPTSGAFLGYVSHNGHPITIDGLWGITFGGNTPLNGPGNYLFFTSGPSGYTHGLFGVITVDSTPEQAEEILPELKAPNGDLEPSTIPANGDLNPYGLAFVPPNFPSGGTINPGDALVSNFNSSSNLQGTGTTIVDVNSMGAVSTFFQGSPGLGLDTALGVLQSGFVIVGNVPTTDGMCDTIQAGSLLVLNKSGTQINSFSSMQFLDGPWDLTFIDSPNTPIVFVSNVLSGTVTRLNLQVQNNNLSILSMTQIGSNYMHACNQAALVVGPTGLAYNSANDTLYVASTDDNAIYSIPNASTRTTDAGVGTLFYSDNTHLHGPLGLVRAPNGDFLIANGDAINPDPNQPSEIVEIDQSGRFLTQLSIDPNQGAAFGIAIDPSNPRNLRLAAVEDALNALDLWNVQ